MVSPYDVFTSQALSVSLPERAIVMYGVENALLIADDTARQALQPCDICDCIYHMYDLVEAICEQCWVEHIADISPTLLMAF